MARIKRVLTECILCGGDFKILKTTEPCPACKKEYLSIGVMLIETVYKWVDGKRILTGTGDAVVVEDALFRGWFPGVTIPEHKAVMIKPELLEDIRKNAG